ncbi:hypothetical protein [Streptomyces acidiscabies]|nr:hypothetical protein [Streptomyces acidiscabies]
MTCSRGMRRVRQGSPANHPEDGGTVLLRRLSADLTPHGTAA